MYLNHYNLKEKPFNISPDSRFLWMSDKHKEGLASLKYGVMENKGFLVLTGDIATGKTLLINVLIRITKVKALIATIPDPDLEIMDFFMLLAEEFNMPKKFASKGQFLVQFKQFLLDSYASDKSVLLIIDEAQRLNSELLEQIRLLSNIELDNRKLLNIFFVGQSEFNKMLSEERHKAVRQRISVSYHIDPLTEQETRHYINHRLNIAGCKKELFKPEALRRIYAFSRGYPRLINIICDHALLTGYSGGKKVIDASVIRECEKELKIPIEQPEKQEKEAEFFEPREQNPFNVLQDQSAGKRIGYFAVIILLLLATGYILLSMQSKDEPRWKIEEIAPQSYDSPTLKAKETFVPGVVGETDGNKDQPQIKGFDEQVIEGKEIASPMQSNLQDQTEETNTIPEVKPFPDRKIIIYFKHNSNDLSDQAYDMLDRIAGFMVSNPDASININGYTDSSGAYSYNVSVSQFRANMVKGYLVGKGVDPLKIEAIGLGPKNPIASNATEKGRQTNRRVEIELNIDKP